jgi:hypothetical protein
MEPAFIVIYFYLMFSVAVTIYAGRLDRTAGWFFASILMSPVVAWALLAALGEHVAAELEPRDTIIDDREIK